MTFADEDGDFRIELDTENFDCTAEQIEHIERMLDVLREPVRSFPVRDLHIDLTYHPRSRDFRVKVVLVLPGRTFATGDLDADLYPALERCVHKLLQRVTEYKAHMSGVPEVAKHVKGTEHEVLPAQEPDAQVLEAALDGGDYAAFRGAMLVYEEAVWLRVGRWVNRYPQMAEEIGGQFEIADVVEEVFLNAFERYANRPQQVRLGEWLEQLIDPSIKLLLRSPDEEMQNISFARTLTGNE